MNLRIVKPLLFAIAAAWLPLTCIGCGKSGVASVSGTVLHQDGSPVIGARVIARSNETGKTANGETDSAGHYELGAMNAADGIAAGEYYLIVVENLGDENQRRPATISTKYAKSATSGLKFSVQTGEKKTFDMKLDAK
jgi:hypothetical protein